MSIGCAVLKQATFCGLIVLLVTPFGFSLAQTSQTPATQPQKQADSQPGQAGGAQAEQPPELMARDVHGAHSYAIGIGDVVRVDVFEEPQFDRSAVVRPDGKISLPLISDVAIAGLTPVQTEQLLAAKLATYVHHPKVTVTVEEIHSRVVYVTGEVLRPGAYALTDTINVVQLIARAGGTTSYAKKKQVYVLRAGTGAKVKVDYRKVLLGQHIEQNVQLNPGDTVVVP
jgi:polysaccharide export outer membrane protein